MGGASSNLLCVVQGHDCLHLLDVMGLPNGNLDPLWGELSVFARGVQIV